MYLENNIIININCLIYIKNKNTNIIINIIFYINIFYNKYWGLGIGDWGLGIGDWAQSPIPNPQSPIPIPIPIFQFYLLLNSKQTIY